ncbi:MAG: hypothetical protein AAGH79_18930 [Bacteroidota bacterium]
MKKLLFALLLLVTNSIGLSASVNPHDLIVRVDVSSATFVVRSTIPMNAETKIELLNADGLGLYNGTIAEKHYLNKRFPLASIADGEYQLILSDLRGKTIQPLVVKKGVITQDLALAKQQFFPRVDLQDNRLMVVRYNNKEGNRINISVANGSGETVFQDQVKGEDIKRAYQLDKLEAGAYYVTFSSRTVRKHTVAIALD